MRWNHQVAMERRDTPWIFGFVDAELVDQAIREPAVVHFAGPAKP